MLQSWEKSQRVFQKVWKFKDRGLICINFPEHILKAVISQLCGTWNKSSSVLEVADKKWWLLFSVVFGGVKSLDTEFT